MSRQGSAIKAVGAAVVLMMCYNTMSLTGTGIDMVQSPAVESFDSAFSLSSSADEQPDLTDQMESSNPALPADTDTPMPDPPPPLSTPSPTPAPKTPSPTPKTPSPTPSPSTPASSPFDSLAFTGPSLLPATTPSLEPLSIDASAYNFDGPHEYSEVLMDLVLTRVSGPCLGKEVLPIEERFVSWKWPGKIYSGVFTNVRPCSSFPALPVCQEEGAE